MNEHDKARKWREANVGTREQLAEKLGYSVESIYWYERGINPPRGKHRKQEPIASWVWQRYKLACAGLQAQIEGNKFNW